MERPFSAYEGDEPYVFVCYAHDDAAVVYPELTRLRQAGFRIWYDEGVSPGLEWSQSLADHIEGCSTFLYFVTPRSVESEHCRREVSFALDQKCRMQVVHLEPTELPSALKLSLGHRQAVHRYELSAEVYAEKVAAALRGQLEGAGAYRGGVKRLRPTAAAKGLLGLGVVLSALLIGYLLLREPGRLQAPGGAQDRAIAVLSFDNLSSDPEIDFFGAGVAEDILGLLSRVPGLRVISGSSSFALADEPRSSREIAKLLNVQLLIDGSVRRQADRFRISVRLIDAVEDVQLWSEVYEHRADNEFAAQSGTAAAVVAALAAQLGLETGRRPRAVFSAVGEAHEAYLRGRHLVRQRSPAAIRKAIDEFERAIDLDPDYALAHAELVMALYLSTSGPEEQRQVEAKIGAHIIKAVELDPDLPETQAALAWHRSGDEAASHLRRAIELNPNYSDAWYWLYSMTDVPLGLEERFSALQQAVRLDPLSQPANWDYILGLIARNRVLDAAAQITKFESIDSQGAIMLDGLLESLAGGAADWFLAYLKAASVGSDELIFGRHLGWQWLWQFEQLGLVEEMLARPDELDVEMKVYLGDMEAGISEARAWLATHPDSGYDRRKLGEYLAHAGQYDEARPYLEGEWDWYRQNRIFDTSDVNNVVYMEALIAVRRYAGEAEGADEALQLWLDSIHRQRTAGITATYYGFYSVDYNEGIAEFLAGDRERALVLIRQAVEDGFALPPPSAYQQERYAQPEVAALLERRAEIQARERQRVLAVVCEDNPYPQVWQPLAQTCTSSAGELNN